MGKAITPVQLKNMLRDPKPPVVADVRKELALAASGHLVPSAVRIRSGDIAGAVGALSGHMVVVYCVHGHEVSQGACDVLRGAGIDAYYLEGGIEGWREAGFDVEPWTEGRAL